MKSSGSSGLDFKSSSSARARKKWARSTSTPYSHFRVKDGWTATTEAKADPVLSKIPIIALTAHALEADKIRAMEAGADEFDTKPVNLSSLLEKIESF